MNPREELYPSPLPVPRLDRIRIRNYKSIGKADVALGSLNVLVGRNGAGKSNFLDLLRFVSGSLRSTPQNAFVSQAFSHGAGRAAMAVEIDMSIPGSCRGTFGFEIAQLPYRGFKIKREVVEIRTNTGELIANYDVRSGVVLRA